MATQTMTAAHSVVDAVEAAAALPSYQAEVLARAPEAAQHDSARPVLSWDTTSI